MQTEFPHVARLDGLIRRLSAVESPAEVFKILLEASRLAAPRAAVLLVRQGQLHGWGSVGYDTETAQQLRRFRAPLDHGWTRRMAAGIAPLIPRNPDETDPQFGQPEAVEAVGCMVRVKDKPIAVLIAERPGTDAAWYPEVMAMTVTVAQLRLELDVWQRRVHSLQQSPDAGTAKPSDPAPATATARPTAAAATPAPPMTADDLAPNDLERAANVAPQMNVSVEVDTTTSAVAPVEPAADELPPEIQAARRYARLVATDIRLYNEESVVLGRKNGDLCKRIGDHIGRGKETFLRRHGDLGPNGLEILHEAYVQVLAGGDGQLIPRSSLD